jgi:serine protease Do
MNRARALSVFLACSLLLVPLGAATPPPPQQAQQRPRAWLGVSLDAAEEDPARTAAIDAGEPLGSLITGVVRDSPADRAGLRAGDLVLRFAGHAVDSPGALMARIGAAEPEEWADLEVLRRGALRRLSVRVGSRPLRDTAWVFRQGWIGVVGIEVPLQLRTYWGGSADQGVLVGEVVERGPAEAAGLRPGDLILQVEGQSVGAEQELERRVQLGGIGNELRLLISRQGTELELEVEVIDMPEPEPEVEN